MLDEALSVKFQMRFLLNWYFLYPSVQSLQNELVGLRISRLGCDHSKGPLINDCGTFIIDTVASAIHHLVHQQYQND
jgi:hypothetical protein